MHPPRARTQLDALLHQQFGKRPSTLLCSAASPNLAQTRGLGMLSRLLPQGCHIFHSITRRHPPQRPIYRTRLGDSGCIIGLSSQTF